MQQQVATTFTAHRSEQKTGGRNGTWTNHVFTAADGTEFETGSQTLANQAYALLNQPITATYESSQYGPKLKAVTAGHAAGAPTAVAGASAPAPTAGAPAPNQGAPAGGGGSTEREARITRMGALNSALKAIEIGVLPKPANRDQLFQMADIIVGYAVHGRQAGTQAAATSLPAAAGGDANGGQAATAAPVAETAPAAAAAAPAGPSDDIPF